MRYETASIHQNWLLTLFTRSGSGFWKQSPSRSPSLCLPYLAFPHICRQLHMIITDLFTSHRRPLSNDSACHKLLGVYPPILQLKSRSWERPVGWGKSVRDLSLSVVQADRPSISGPSKTPNKCLSGLCAAAGRHWITQLWPATAEVPWPGKTCLRGLHNQKQSSEVRVLCDAFHDKLFRPNFLLFLERRGHNCTMTVQKQEDHATLSSTTGPQQIVRVKCKIYFHIFPRTVFNHFSLEDFSQTNSNWLAGVPRANFRQKRKNQQKAQTSLNRSSVVGHYIQVKMKPLSVLIHMKLRKVCFQHAQILCFSFDIRGERSKNQPILFFDALFADCYRQERKIWTPIHCQWGVYTMLWPNLGAWQHGRSTQST